MVWDFAILYMGVSLAIAGWQLGIVNSWPTPIAVILATAFTQMFYVNAGALLLDQTRLPGDLAFFIAYVMVWVAFETVCEAVLLLLLPIKKRYTAGIPSRVAGALVGTAKFVMVMTFASAAGVSALAMPNAPDRPAIAGWVCESSYGSKLLRCSKMLASKMPMALAQRVVSEQAPMFKPTFQDQSVLTVDAYKARKWRELFEGLHDLESQLSQL